MTTPAWPEHGSFVRSRARGAMVHIVVKPLNVKGWWEMACGRRGNEWRLLPADGDEPGQCAACWKAM